MAELSLYYDFSCPWSYLALVRLQDVADRNATTLQLCPVDVNGVLATENPSMQASRLAENPAKAAWQRADLADWARFWGLRIELDETWPRESALAAAAGLAAIELGQGIEYSLALFAAAFGNGADISDTVVLTQTATDVGLDSAAFQAALEQAGDKVAERSEELVRRGGFGTPTVFVDDQMFFGNDRIPLVEWVLGPVSEADFVMPGQHDG